MRVRDYLAALVITCVISAFALEYVVTQRFDASRAALERVGEHAKLAADFRHVRQNLGQFLVTTDLIIASDETYLIRGANRQFELLNEQLQAFEAAGAELADPDDLRELVAGLHDVSALVDAAGRLEPEGREQALNSLLRRFDPTAAAMTERADSIDRTISARLVEDQKRNETSASEARLARLAAVAVFLTIVLSAWRWASRQIVTPLARLADMANETTAKEAFPGVQCGPREIVVLSDRYKALTERLVYQASHDPLTGLVNRRELERLLGRWQHEQVERHGEGETIGVICYIDLDRFKVVNDTCGHAAGDELLCRVAETFRTTVRGEDIVARLGGDEFCIVLKHCTIDEGLDIAESLRARVEDLRFETSDQVFRISASIGAATLVTTPQGSDSIIDQADAACAVAKESGRNRLYVFDLLDERMDQKRLDMIWINEVTHALEEQRLVLFKQRIVPCKPTGDPGDRFEILLRLRMADGQIVLPSRFLPVAERYGLGCRVDKWVLKTTLAWLRRRPGQTTGLASCSINLSADSLSQPAFLTFAIDQILDSGIAPSKLCFEITETRAIDDIDSAQRFIRALRELGCRFALDDFGTGHSSFGYLRDLPVDYVKIDGSFVRNMLENRIDRATVASLVEVSAACGKRTVAECVESAELLRHLRELGVDFVQGYHVGRPEEVGEHYELEFSDVVHI